MTILLGPAPCVACRQSVTVVKRTAEVGCAAGALASTHDGIFVWDAFPDADHTHAIPDVALAVVDADGSTHICPLAAA